MTDSDKLESQVKLKHICETCGKTEILTSEEGFEAGWDYPPRIGAFGVISPRTCGDCVINTTLWWALALDKASIQDLNERQLETLKRIQSEPESILISGES